MLETVNALMCGDRRIVDCYLRATGRWKRLLNNTEMTEVVDLAGILSTQQQWFEQNCGGGSLGQEIMVNTAFASLYDLVDGWGTDQSPGYRLMEAFRQSSCSIELKRKAQGIAEAYQLI